MADLAIFPGMDRPASCFQCPMRIPVDPENIRCMALGERFEEPFELTIKRRHPKCPMLFVSGLSDSALILLQFAPDLFNVLAAKVEEKIGRLILYGSENQPEEVADDED